MAKLDDFENKLKKSLEFYKTDYRRYKIGNILTIIKAIKETPGIKLDELLSTCNVNEPFINKKKAFGYIKDMVKTKHIKVNLKTKEVEICQ